MSAPTSAAMPRVHVLEILGNAIVGGMETYVNRLVRGLLPRNFRVTILCPFASPMTSALAEAGCDVIVAPIADDPRWATIQLATTLIAKHDIDVIHANLSNAHALAALVSAVTGRACLATIHGRAISLLDLEAHRLTENAHMTVVCQAAYYQALALGVDPQRLHHIANGVDIGERAIEPSASLHNILGLPKATTVVGYIGRLAPEKGPDLFLRMARLLATDPRDVHFVLIGDGPMRQTLEKMAGELAITNRVHFTGVRDDVDALLPSLVLTVLSSHAEGMPLALMEAMAAGLPVVATSVGGVPELVEHRYSGYLVSPDDPRALADAVKELLDNEPLRLRMGAAARVRARDHWPQSLCTERMGALLRQLARSRVVGTEVSRPEATVAAAIAPIAPMKISSKLTPR
ncbi:MAG: glycosyltransferase family 4 protein [Betaproteobacteria bacterium]|nr:glycosyltransferase family 4 protein [Betaproteobacteria bacterium]